MNEPAFMMFPTEFIMETSFMTKSEVCDYIRILCNLHFFGHLTLKKMEKICGGKISEAILENLEVDKEGLFYHKRMEYEAQKRSEYSESRRKNAATKRQATEEKRDEPKGAVAEEKKGTVAEGEKSAVAEEKRAYGPYGNVMLTDGEYKELSERFCSGLEARIKALSEYIKIKGVKYDCHYAVIIQWDEKNKERAAEEKGFAKSTFETDDFWSAAVENSRYCILGQNRSG